MNLRALVFGTAVACLALASGCAAPADSGAEVTDESNLDEYALPASSPLRIRTAEIDQIWGDENIMNGRADALAFRLRVRGVPRDSSLTKTAMKILLDRAADDEMELDPSFREVVEPLDDDVIARVGRTVALDGFVYSDNRDNVEPKIEEVRSIVTLLGDPSKIAAVTVEGAGTVPWNDGTTSYRASAFLFVNKETGESAAFFVREGWI